MAAEFPAALPTFAHTELDVDAGDFPENVELQKLQAEVLAVCTKVGITGGAPGEATPLAINAQTGTTYTFVAADAGKLVTHSNAAAITATVPANATTAFPVGTQIILEQIGAGVLTVAAAGGVTINGRLTAPYQYGVVVLRKIATDTWLIANVPAAAAAWVQTYSTAHRTIAAATYVAPSVTAVAPVTTGSSLTAYGYTQSQADAISLAVAALCTDNVAQNTQLAALAADVLQLKKNVVALAQNEIARGQST